MGILNFSQIGSEEVHILVFKTNIRFKKDLAIIESLMNRNDDVLHWNVDKHDKDKILRIESTSHYTSQIIADIEHAGYFCEELTD